MFADSDFFDDRFWVSEQNYLGQRFGVPIADNGKFLLNAVENMMGSSDLIFAGRERIARPFTRVEALRRAAEAQYLAEEENSWRVLKWRRANLTASSARRTAWRCRTRRTAISRRTGGGAQSLRDVQGNLRRDIDTLAGQVTFVNIVVMPILVGLAALVLAWRQRRRRRATKLRRFA